MVSRLIEKATKFENQSQINVLQKREPFLDVCNISKLVSPASDDAEQTNLLSPKRSESPTGKNEFP